MRRLLTGSLTTFAAVVFVNVGAANAADLLVLNGDPPAVLSGDQQYGIVYIDGELKLTGDTVINASSIYIGPDAQIDSCYVPGTGDGQCTAGRSLTLTSTGPLTVAPAINLETGSIGGPGGGLSLSGTSVSVGGQISTGGAVGSPSGPVSISSSGPISAQGIYAPGAPVTISGSGPVLLGGEIQTQGAETPAPASPSTLMQAGGAVTISASGGDVDIDGAIAAQGQSGPSGGGSGGAGGAVTITGANVHAEAISTVGGSSQATGSGPGPSAPVSITASGNLAVSGTIASNGAGGAGGTGVGGAAVNLKAAGTVGLGAVTASGGQTAPGAPITIAGTSVVAGDLNASGGGGTTSNRNGAGAAAISVTAPLGATLGALLAAGGNSDGNASLAATPGTGAGITVVSSTGSVSTGRVESGGGTQGTGPGASGGPIVLNAADDLTVAGDLRADGSAAGGSSTPWNGGSAGTLFLAAATGTMDLGGNASAQGGAGSANGASGQLGGSGGSGGQVTLIAHAIGLLTSLSAAGGAGGGNDSGQGPGGPGASITAYTNDPLFNSQRLVSSDGGDGNPTGAAGNQQLNSSPASLAMSASGIVSFTSQSPDATGYLLQTVPTTGTPTTVEKTLKTTGLTPATALCQSVQLEVVAVNAALGWTSEPSTAISYTHQPSKTQTCAAPAKLKLPSKLTLTLKRAQHLHWTKTLHFRSAGIGTVTAVLKYKTVAGRHGSRYGTFTTELKLRKAGAHKLNIRLPRTVRAAGSGSVKLTVISPDGDHRKTQTLKFKVSA